MKLTGSRCRCAVCGECFNSVSMFDRHRIGKYAASVARCCLSVEAMQTRGWSKNAAGFWIRRQYRAGAGTARDEAAFASQAGVDQAKASVGPQPSGATA